MIVAGSGLQPRSAVLLQTNGCGVNTMLSTFHVYVTTHIDWFGQASLSVNVKLCVRIQPLVNIAPATQSKVGVGSQTAETLATHLATAQFGVAGGLHPRLIALVGQPLMTGGVGSFTYIVCTQEATFEQPSVAFQ